MDELKAVEIAEVLGGEAYLLEADVWVVVIERQDGRIVALSVTSVDEYADWGAFRAGHRYESISLTPAGTAQTFGGSDQISRPLSNPAEK